MNEFLTIERGSMHPSTMSLARWRHERPPPTIPAPPRAEGVQVRGCGSVGAYDFV